MVAQILISAQMVVTGSALLTAGISLIALGMKVNRNHRELMDSKVDKIDYVRHCEKSEQLFNVIQHEQTEIQKETNKLLSQLIKSQGKIETDIEWIKKKVV